jgi:MFS transporter, DHA3 family, macrolide efflux protein
MIDNRPDRGTLTFLVVWSGQVVSLLGTAMTLFAQIIWAWQLTGSATALAQLAFFHFTPLVLLSPLAGALVDRWNRRAVMILSDLAAGLATIGLLALFLAGRLEIWHLYAAAVVAGAAHAFQWPAYSAAITLLLPKAHYARASGMISMADSGAHIAAPLLAGLLLGPLGLGGILLIDIATFSFAVATLLFVRIPQPAITAEGQAGRGSLLHESVYGFRYIWQRRSLLGLQLVLFAGNITVNIVIILMPAMILARSGQNAVLLGSVQSVGAVGGVLGGLLMTAWGGPKRRIHGVLLTHVAAGACWLLWVLGAPAWYACAFAFFFAGPILNGSNQAIWQSKVAPDVQGRVFAARRLIAQISAPAAMLLAGNLADRVFEPAMQAGQGLAGLAGRLLGSEPGMGMALMMAMAGAATIVVGLVPYGIRAIRDVEDILPDHERLAQDEPPAALDAEAPAPAL